MQFSTAFLVACAAVLAGHAFALTKLTSDQVKTQQNDFKSGRRTAAATTLFDSVADFRQHSPTLFTNMTRAQASTMIHHMCFPGDHFDGVKCGGYLGTLSPSDTDNINDNATCGYIYSKALYLNLNLKIFNGPTRQCIESMLDSSRRIQMTQNGEVWRKPVAHLISKTVMKENGAAVLRHLGGQIHLLSEEQIEKLVLDSDNCTAIAATSMSQLSKSQPAKITSQCFAKIPRPEDLGIAPILHRFGKNIFEHFPSEGRLSREVVKKISPEQMENYGRQVHDTERCQNLYLDAINDAAAAKVSPNCFKSWALNQTGSIALNNLWDHFPDNILSAFNDNDISQLLDKMSVNETNKIKPGQMAFVIDKKAGCANLKTDTDISSAARLDFTLECINALSPKLRAKYLTTNLKPHEKTLATTNASQIAEFEHSDSNQGTVTGLAVLQFIRSKAMIGKIFQSASIDQSGSHVCASIQSMDELMTPLKFLHPYLTRPCVEALKFKLTAKDYKAVPELMNLQAFDKLQEFMTEDDWRNIEKDTLSRMLKGGKLASEMDYATFNFFRVELLPLFGKESVSQLIFLDKLTIEQKAALGDDAYAKMDKDQLKAKKVALEEITDKQLVFVSADVEDLSKNIAAEFTSKTIEAMKAERVAKLSARQWAATPADAYAAITADKFKVILPESMTDMTLAQLSKVPLAVLKTITKAQAEKVGINVKDSKTNPAGAFKKAFDGMDKEARAVLEKRLSGAASLVPTGFSVLAVLFGFALLV